jgi:hypothetical protein
MTEQRIFRGRHKSNFSALSNGIWVDEKLSVEAKGTLGYLLSRPPNWHVRLGQVGRQLKIGKDKLQRIFRELIAAGYVERRQQGRKRGAFAQACYYVCDKPSASVATLPQPVKPQTAKPQTAKPQTAKRAAYKRRNLTNTDSTKQSYHKTPSPTPYPTERSERAAPKRLSNEAFQRKEHPSVVQDRVARRLGLGDVADGWRMFGELAEDEQNKLTDLESKGGVTNHLVMQIRAEIELRVARPLGDAA